MNERIRKLAVKAQIYFTYDRGPGTDNELQAAEITQSDFEKFAELLIRECVGVVNDNMDDILDQPVFNPTDEIWNRARVEELVRVALHIKKHFGVKE